MANANKHQVNPPQLANNIMTLLLPRRFAENVIGDLEEEFYQRAEQDPKAANKWYWHQSTETSMIYLSKKFGSIEFLGRVNFYVPVVAFILMIALISLLSNMDDPSVISDSFWDELLAGKIHTALFSEGFWDNFREFIFSTSFGMFIDIPSIIITTFNIGVLFYLDKKQNASALRLAIWGYGLMLVPYIWGLIHIGSNDLEARQIGPVIAIMLLSLMYMLLPVSYLVHRKLRLQQKRQKQYESELE